MCITYPGVGSAALVIAIENGGVPQLAPPSPGGQGIAGMRERAQAFGDTLEAGPRPEGRFAIRATLPGASWPNWRPGPGNPCVTTASTS